MKLRIIVDNNTYVGQYYFGEPGACYYIEDEGTRVLLDTGYSDILVPNAEKLGVDLSSLDVIAFSHGHDDHTGGFPHLFPLLKDPKKVRVVLHPAAFEKKRNDNGRYFGVPENFEELVKKCDAIITKEPVKISPHITYLGEIPVTVDFEEERGIGEHLTERGWERDPILDDSALVYEGKDGIFIITACSHSGVCNIVNYARRLFPGRKVTGLLGGFHLPVKNEKSDKTAEFLASAGIKDLYPCHCICFQVKADINRLQEIHEVGVGMSIAVD